MEKMITYEFDGNDYEYYCEYTSADVARYLCSLFVPKGTRPDQRSAIFKFAKELVVEDLINEDALDENFDDWLKERYEDDARDEYEYNGGDL